MSTETPLRNDHGTPRRSDERLLIVVGILLVGIVGSCITLIMPAVLEHLVRERGFGVSQVALVASIEMVGITISIVASAPFMATFDRRKLLLGALVLAATGHVAAASTPNYPLFSAFRLLAGCGEGAMVASMSAAIAGTPQPDRLFAVYLTCNMLVSMVFLRVIPLLPANSAVTVIYASLGVLTALCVFCLPAFPRLGQPDSGSTASVARKPAGVLQLLGQAHIALSLLGTLVFFTGIGMAWPLMGQLGVSFGLSSAQVAGALAMSVVAGAIAGVCTSWLGTRLGRRIPLVLSTLGIVFSLLLLVLQGNPGNFTFATPAFMSAWVTSTAYYMGTVASLDATGRASTFGVAMQSTGLFVGPAVAAVLVRGAQFDHALWGRYISVQSRHIDHDSRRLHVHGKPGELN